MFLRDTKHSSRTPNSRYGMKSFGEAATKGGVSLLLLMTVAAQTLLALVRGYLMAFTFLTARHTSFVLMRLLE